MRRDAQLLSVLLAVSCTGAEPPGEPALERYHDLRVDDPSGIIRHFAGTATAGYSGDGGPAWQAALRTPTRLTFGDAGNLYVCDTGDHVIRRIAPDGIITTIAGTGAEGFSGDGGPATEARLDRPLDIALHPGGGYLIADSGNSAIRFVEADGRIRTVAGTGEDGFSGDGGPALEARLHTPHSVTIGPDGALWIADSYNNRIRKIGPTY